MLFSFFINEIIDVMNNSGIRGIQLFPDVTELLLLLFADDVALLSDTVVGLQRQLNILNEFCTESGLTENTENTKIMVYKHGGRLSRHGQWSFNNTWLIVVNTFSYVSVTFTKQLSLSSMAQSQCLKAKRALTILLDSLYKYGVLSHSVYFKMFETNIKLISVYGS